MNMVENLEFLDMEQLSDEQLDFLIQEVKNNKVKTIPTFSPAMKLTEKKKELLVSLLENNPTLDEYIISWSYDIANKLKNEILNATLKRKVFSNIEVTFLKRNNGYNFVVALIGINFDLALDILKNETIYMNKEEYSNLYRLLKDKIDINNLIDAPSIKCNPFFVIDFLKQGGDIKKINPNLVDYYEEFFDEINEVCQKRNTEIPIPKKNIEKFTSIKDLKTIVEKKYNKKDIIIFEIMVDSEKELEISKGIEYLKELEKEGYRVFFQYNKSSNSNPLSLKTIINSEKFLNMIVDDINSKNLSTFEKYILIFQLVRNFKKYNEEDNKKSPSISRQLYEILNNDYIVCAGYTNLMVNLCERLNIPAKYERLVSDGIGGHARPYFHIIDEKYGIDGYYTSEPTWIKTGSIDKLSNPIMTTKEAANTIEYRFDSVLQIKTIEEFQKLSSDDKKQIFNYLKELDPVTYNKIINLDLSKEENQKIIVDYLSKKIDKPISKKIIAKAMAEAQYSIYSERTDNISKKELYIRNLLNIDFNIMEIIQEPEFLEYINIKSQENSELTISEIEKKEDLSNLIVGYYSNAIPNMTKIIISKEDFIRIKEIYPDIEDNPAIIISDLGENIKISMKRIKKEKSMKLKDLISKVELNRMFFYEIMSYLSEKKVTKK